MEKCFAKLHALIPTARRFVFNSGEEYLGPVHPVGICRHRDNKTGHVARYFVLAERVPAKFARVAEGSGGHPTRVVLALLDSDYNFAQWDPNSRTLGGLFSLQSSAEGTIEGACRELSDLRFSLRLEFKLGESDVPPVEEKIKKTFPSALVRANVLVRSLRDTTEIDLLVMLPAGIFMLERKGYSGKISGSFDAERQDQEAWGCETAAGKRFRIEASGENPAARAQARFHAFRDLAKQAWGEKSLPPIYAVLLFPDDAELSSLAGVTVAPERPSSHDSIVVTTASKLMPYLANAEGNVERRGTLKLIDFLGIPRSDITDTWCAHEAPALAGAGAPAPVPSAVKEATPRAEKSADHSGAREADNFSRDRSRKRRELHKPIVAVATLVVALPVFFIAGWQWFRSAKLEGQSDLPVTETALLDPPVETAQPSSVATVTPQGGSADPERSEPSARNSEIAAQQKSPGDDKPPSPGGAAKNTAGGAKVASAATRAPLGRSAPPAARTAPSRRGPAEAGTYETIRTTFAYREPGGRGEIIDELKPGIKLNVIGSRGDWLIVRSRTRQVTAYVRRDDTMLVAAKKGGREAFEQAERRWKKIELDLREALIRRGVTGVSVTFIDDTAYLKGQVRTEDERHAAEQAARTVPEVREVFNRIWVVP